MIDASGLVLTVSDGPEIFQLDDDAEGVWIIAGPVSVWIGVKDSDDGPFVEVTLHPNGNETNDVLDTANCTFAEAREQGGMTPDEAREAFLYPNGRAAEGEGLEDDDVFDGDVE